jgi:hypothetical protein
MRNGIKKKKETENKTKKENKTGKEKVNGIKEGMNVPST